MAQLSDDCFAFDGPLMPVEEAVTELRSRLAPLIRPTEIEISAALNRFLAADVISGETVPPADNSAVDGFAVSFDDLNPTEATELPVVGRAAAGHPFLGHVKRGQALQIFTGALMPAGTDTVMMSEDCKTCENDEGDVSSMWDKKSHHDLDDYSSLFDLTASCLQQD